MLTRSGHRDLAFQRWLLIFVGTACVVVAGCHSGKRSTPKIDTKSRPAIGVSAAMKGKILNAAASLVTVEGLDGIFESDQAEILEKARRSPGARLLFVQFDVTEEAIRAAHAQYFGPSLFKARWGTRIQDPDGATATMRIENNRVVYPSTVKVLYVVPPEVRQLDVVYAEAVVGTVSLR